VRPDRAVEIDGDPTYGIQNHIEKDPHMSSINLSFLIFELIMYFLFVACFIHAWKRGLSFVTELLGGLLFGIILEYVNVRFLVDYHYGRFLVMLGEIPLCIGVGWSVIIYSSIALSDRLGFRTWTRPLLDAFLALNIDLSMDTIAIRLGGGMWVWGFDPAVRWTSEWFGVPFGNFFGWFFVLLLYSAAVRTARYISEQKNLKTLWKSTYPLLGVAVSELILMALIMIFTALSTLGVPSWLMFIIPIAVSAVLLVIFAGPRPGNSPSGWIIHAVPLSFHAFFLASLIIFPITAWTPWILLISVSMVIISIIVQIIVTRTGARTAPQEEAPGSG
jgi:hypothetical protein